MAKEEPGTDWGKIIGDCIVWIIRLAWKSFLITLWGMLRLIAVIAEQTAKFLKPEK